MAVHERRSLAIQPLATAAMCCVMAIVGLSMTSCKRASDANSDSPVKYSLQIQAASSLREILPELVAAFEKAHPEMKGNPRFAGSQTLARQIEAGVEVDVFLSADRNAIQTLGRRPNSDIDWISNDLVVIAPAHSNAEIDNLAMGDGRVAIAADAVPLGSYTRLALRKKEIWRPVEARASQFTSAAAVLQQVASESFDFGVVYATDAAVEPDRVRILGVLALPHSVEIVYAAASFSLEGESFVQWLRTPEAVAITAKAGFTLPGALRGTNRTDTNK